MKLLEGQVALITGAAAGIGAGVARLFAEHGGQVYVTDKDGSGAEAVAASIRQTGGAALAFVADVRDAEAIARTVDHALTHFGHVDILINNAGVYPRQPFLGMTEEQWDTMQDINLKGVFHCTRLVLPSMVKQRSGPYR